MPRRSSQDWPNQQVPKRAAGVYTVWEGDRLLYVGMSGRAMTAEDRSGEPEGAEETGMARTRLDGCLARLTDPAAPFRVGTACRTPGPVACRMTTQR